MYKIRTFTIELRNPQGVYYPRQVVRGEVILELDAPAKVRGKGFFAGRNIFLFLGLENRCIDSTYYFEIFFKKYNIFATNKTKQNKPFGKCYIEVDPSFSTGKIL